MENLCQPWITGGDIQKQKKKKGKRDKTIKLKQKRTKLKQCFGLYKDLQPQSSAQGEPSDACPPQQCVTWARTPPTGPPRRSPTGLLQNREKRINFRPNFGLYQTQSRVQDDHSDAWPPQQCVTGPRTPPPGPPWNSPKGLLQNREKRAKF